MRCTKLAVSICLGIAVLSLVSRASAQANETANAECDAQANKLLKPVEEYVKTIEDFGELESGPHVVFADISDYNQENASWRRFESEAEFGKARKTAEAYAIAYVWLKNGDTIAVNFTLSSPSGDWAQFVLYLFRPDGTLAKIDSTLNTFYGDATVLRTLWFDSAGKLLCKTEKFRDLETKEIFDPKKRDFFDREVEIYKNVLELPFCKLLKAENPTRKSN